MDQTNNVSSPVPVHNHRTQLMLGIALVIVVAGFITYTALHRHMVSQQPQSITDQQKQDIINKLQQDATNYPQPTLKQQQTAIGTMNKNSKELTPDQKAALISQSAK